MYGPVDRSAAQHHLRVVLRRAALGADQVVPAVGLKMCGPSIQIGFFAGSTPPSTSILRGPDVLQRRQVELPGSRSRGGRRSAAAPGGPLLITQALPSSSKNSDGSMPLDLRSHTGSDHGPAGSRAVMTKLPPQSTQVLKM